MDVELQPPGQEELPDRTPPVDSVALGPRPMKSLFGTDAANIDVHGTQDLPRKKDLRALPTGSGLPSFPGSSQQGSRQLAAQVQTPTLPSASHVARASVSPSAPPGRLWEQRRPHRLACVNASMPLAMNDFSALPGGCLSSPGAMPVMDASSGVNTEARIGGNTLGSGANAQEHSYLRRSEPAKCVQPRSSL
ncbi:hypothetical protein EI555_016998 [Monodon monoceros]|uniref:Uncharacterized protein n=1 Tax=Monodon monoceros TaxID=40151 RepID=A0A4U1EJR9_MONMO|nr:hypothetical protein EI555_016998 [Monodon monoceros]